MLNMQLEGWRWSVKKVTNLSIFDLLSCYVFFVSCIGKCPTMYDINVKAIKALFTGASGLRLFQSLTFYQVRFLIAAWQPGSLGVWMVYFITAGSMAGNLYKWWQAGWLQPELREHCARTYWYKYSKTGYIWYDTNTQETLITSQGNHNNAHNQIVKETYQEINEETLVIHQIHQLIIFFLILV